MTCQARSTQDGFACAACKVRWDRDDARECARVEAPPLAPEPPAPYYVSALAPSRWSER